MFDGDVDALWVENMNSVMDDNRLLTLANGERIRLQTHCALLFEVGDLQYASPATVSRCGMVYLDPKYLGYKPYWEKWVKNRQTVYEQGILKQLFDKYIPIIFEFVIDGIMNGIQSKPLRRVVPLTNLNLIIQFCYMLHFMLNVNDHTEYDLIEGIFLFCIYNSIGNSLVDQEREKFDNYIKYLSNLPGSSDNNSKLIRVGSIPDLEPTLFDYFLDVEQKSWIAWKFMVPKYMHDRLIPFNKILVPTVETVQINWLVSTMVKNHRPLLLVGHTGTSKTATCEQFLRSVNPDKNVCFCFIFIVLFSFLININIFYF